jgi:hypothetical protein
MGMVLVVIMLVLGSTSGNGVGRGDIVVGGSGGGIGGNRSRLCKGW